MTRETALETIKAVLETAGCTDVSYETVVYASGAEIVHWGIDGKTVHLALHLVDGCDDPLMLTSTAHQLLMQTRAEDSMAVCQYIAALFAEKGLRSMVEMGETPRVWIREKDGSGQSHPVDVKPAILAMIAKGDSKAADHLVSRTLAVLRPTPEDPPKRYA